MIRGTWTDPERGKVSLQDYGQRWIEQPPGLRPRTVDLYRWLFGGTSVLSSAGPG